MKRIGPVNKDSALRTNLWISLLDNTHPNVEDILWVGIYTIIRDTLWDSCYVNLCDNLSDNLKEYNT